MQKKREEFARLAEQLEFAPDEFLRVRIGETLKDSVKD
jgi:hypothetical protein